LENVIIHYFMLKTSFVVLYYVPRAEHPKTDYIFYVMTNFIRATG
jgi:hypothetical protein